MEKRRGERLAERLREELEEILNYELEDPRVGAVGITEVLLSSDARRARVRLSLTDQEDWAWDTLAALDGARGHVRSLLMSRLDVYRMPELEFELDSGGEIQPRRRHLLRRMRKGRPKGQVFQDASESQKSPRK
jgi:ribosome-binding factor A